jgi:hypothetical protein
MLRVMHKTPGQPCFLCGKQKETALVKNKNFMLVLCKDHAWERVPDEPKEEAKKEEEGDAAAADGGRRGTAV